MRTRMLFLLPVLMLAACSSTGFRGDFVPQDTFNDPNLGPAIVEGLSDQEGLAGLINDQGLRALSASSTDEVVGRTVTVVGRHDFSSQALVFEFSSDAISILGAQLQAHGIEPFDPFLYMQNQIEAGEDHLLLTSGDMVHITGNADVLFHEDENGRLFLPTGKNGNVTLPTTLVAIEGYGNWRFVRPQKADFQVHRTAPIPESEFAPAVRKAEHDLDRVTAAQAELARLERLTQEGEQLLANMDRARIQAALEGSARLAVSSQAAVPSGIPMGEVESRILAKHNDDLRTARELVQTVGNGLTAFQGEYAALKTALGVTSDNNLYQRRLLLDATNAATTAKATFDAELNVLGMTSYGGDLRAAVQMRTEEANNLYEEAKIAHAAAPDTTTQQTMDEAKVDLDTWVNLVALWDASDAAAQAEVGFQRMVALRGLMTAQKRALQDAKLELEELEKGP